MLAEVHGTQPIAIKTGCWFTPLPPDHLRVGISRGQPRGLAKGYRLYKKLAPGPWFNSVGTFEYEARYSEVLAQLDPQQTLDELRRLAGGKVPVLCCWERAGRGQWCHRALAARWLADALGIEVPEVGFEHLAQADHPLMAPELRQ